MSTASDPDKHESSPLVPENWSPWGWANHLDSLGRHEDARRVRQAYPDEADELTRVLRPNACRNGICPD
jgi:hypothetical protein